MNNKFLKFVKLIIIYSITSLSPEISNKNFEKNIEKTVKVYKIHSEQLNCSYDIIKTILKNKKNNKKNRFILVKGYCQSGKTGVMALSLDILSKFQIYDDVFLWTSLNDIAWKKQTLERIPNKYKKNIKKLSDLDPTKDKNKEFIKSLKNKEICILVDESHYGNKNHQTMGKILDELIKGSKYGKAEYIKKYIQFIWFTATPDKQVINKIFEINDDLEIITLNPGKNYVSLQYYLDNNLVYDTPKLNISNLRKMELDLHKNMYEIDKIFKKHIDYVLNILEKNKMRKKYIIIRIPKEENQETFKARFGTYMENYLNKEYKEFYNTELEYKDQYNIFNFKEKLEQNTFVIVKNSWRVAETLDLDNVGCFIENYTENKNYTSIIQSFAGRILGYHKNKNILLFSNKELIEDYSKYFKCDEFSKLPCPNKKTYSDNKTVLNNIKSSKSSKSSYNIYEFTKENVDFKKLYKLIRLKTDHENKTNDNIHKGLILRRMRGEILDKGKVYKRCPEDNSIDLKKPNGLSVIYRISETKFVIVYDKDKLNNLNN